MATSTNNLKPIFKFLVPVLVLIVLVSYAFRDMLKMIVWGQAFEELAQGAQDNFWHLLPGSLKSFQVSASLLSTFASKLFGLNFSLYYWTWLVISLIVCILLFFLTYSLTGKRLVAFSAALIYGVSFIGQMGLIGWIDTSFVGRVPNLLLLIPSFLFLHLYLKESRLSHYLISILLFFLGIGLGQFGLFLGFSYIFYPLFWYVFKKRISLIKTILVSASFAVISLFFVNIHSDNRINAQGPSYGFGHFLLHPETYHYLEEIPLQLAHWSNYPNLLNGIYLKVSPTQIELPGYSGSLRERFSDVKANKNAAFGITFFYLLAILLIYFRLPEQKPLLLTLIFGSLIMLSQNVYIGHYIPEEQAGASRYLLYPTIWLSVFWALFLWAAFWKSKNRYLILLGFAILGGYYLINVALIQDNLNQMLYGKGSSLRKATQLFAYVKKIRPALKPNTLIITPPDELDCPADIFLNEQIGKGEVVFWPANASGTCLRPPDDLEKIISNSSQVIRLNYEEKCDCVTQEKIK